MTTPMSLHPDHNKFSSLSHTTVVAIFPKLCFWRRSLCSNLGGIDPEKLYRATLSEGVFERRKSTTSKAFSFNMPKRDNVFLAECRYSQR